MARNITNEKCSLYHTRYCDLLNMPTCEACIATDEKTNVEELRSDLDVMESLLPEEGVTDLFESETCQLCKGEHPGKRACYAMLDMAHVEPRRKKRNIIGFKINSRVGTLVSVQLSCCAACRNRIRLAEYMTVLLPVAVGVVLLGILNIRAISEPLKAINPFLPFGVFALLVAAAAVAGVGVRKALVRKFSSVMHVDPLDHPRLKKMMAKGWFPLRINDKQTSIVFSKERLQSGFGTGTKADALAEEAEMQN